jgi:16S rRNA (cytidine1402-2'-O)-methyltransferase
VKGTLFIVSTPIGNLEDITLRALRVLREVDIIAAEDTRHSMKLLTHHGIKKPMISYWGEKEWGRSEEIIRRLHAGQSVALISDAGTPGISDPGSFLIRKAIGENLEIISVPGPSACIAALSVSGLPAEHFTYWGFLPSRKNQRKRILSDLRFHESTLVFYEAPHRIIESLRDMAEIFGERKAALVKELTKLHEQVMRGSISEIMETVEGTTVAGEYAIIVEGWSRTDTSITGEVLSELRTHMRKGLSRKDAVQRIASTYGLSKKELYAKSLDQDSDETP